MIILMMIIMSTFFFFLLHHCLDVGPVAAYVSIRHSYSSTVLSQKIQIPMTRLHCVHVCCMYHTIIRYPSITHIDFDKSLGMIRSAQRIVAVGCGEYSNIYTTRCNCVHDNSTTSTQTKTSYVLILYLFYCLFILFQFLL